MGTSTFVKLVLIIFLVNLTLSNNLAHECLNLLDVINGYIAIKIRVQIKILVCLT